MLTILREPQPLDQLEWSTFSVALNEQSRHQHEFTTASRHGQYRQKCATVNFEQTANRMPTYTHKTTPPLFLYCVRVSFQWMPRPTLELYFINFTSIPSAPLIITSRRTHSPYRQTFLNHSLQLKSFPSTVVTVSMPMLPLIIKSAKHLNGVAIVAQRKSGEISPHLYKY